MERLLVGGVGRRRDDALHAAVGQRDDDDDDGPGGPGAVHGAAGDADRHLGRPALRRHHPRQPHGHDQLQDGQAAAGKEARRGKKDALKTFELKPNRISIYEKSYLSYDKRVKKSI